MSNVKEKISIIIAGLIIGVVAIILMLQGNPGNMGFCIVCFLRDTAGALKLHTAPVVQYLRPEVIGLILGSFLISVATGEFKVRGGSSPVLRFFMGMMTTIGALVFLGCPLRMVLRMAGGDWNAWIGLIGFILGVVVGTIFLRNGFSLNRSHKLSAAEGLAMPVFQVIMLVLLLAVPSVLAFSEEGPGSMRAPIWLALVIALVVGAIAQKTRLCQAGGIRDVVMFGDTTLMWGSIAIFVSAIVMNLIFNKINFAFESQPVAHPEHLWNILGLFIVGLIATLIGGCPMRQLVLAGTGNTDSAITVIGMVIGAAFAHNFNLASSPKGTTPGGRIATIIIIVVLLIIGVMNTRSDSKA